MNDYYIYAFLAAITVVIIAVVINKVSKKKSNEVYSHMVDIAMEIAVQSEISKEMIGYIVDPRTREILSLSEKLKPLHKEGGICYKEFQGLDKECDFCPESKMNGVYKWVFYCEKSNKVYLLFDKWIQLPKRDGLFHLEFGFEITDQLDNILNIRDCYVTKNARRKN